LKGDKPCESTHTKPVSTVMGGAARGQRRAGWAGMRDFRSAGGVPGLHLGGVTWVSTAVCTFLY
jgi:hypothetical protein